MTNAPIPPDTGVKTKIKAYFTSLMERLNDGLCELLLIFLPVALASLPHAIVGQEKFREFVNGPDVTLLCSVLFLDGWWKIRARTKVDKQARALLEILGIAGALFACALTMVLYFVNLKLVQTALVDNVIVDYGRSYAYRAAMFYAFWVRVRPDATESKAEQ